IEDTNTVVYVMGQSYVDGQQWHLTRYENRWGYIHNSQLRFMTYDEVQAYLQSLVTPTPAPLSTPQPVNSNGPSSYAVTTADKVNMRKDAGMDASVQTVLSKDSLLLVLGSTSNGGYTWYRVYYGGTV